MIEHFGYDIMIARSLADRAKRTIQSRSRLDKGLQIAVWGSFPLTLCDSTVSHTRE